MYYSDAEFDGGGGYATSFVFCFFAAVFVFVLFVSLRWMLMFVHIVVKSNTDAVSYDILFVTMSPSKFKIL